GTARDAAARRAGLRGCPLRPAFSRYDRLFDFATGAGVSMTTPAERFPWAAILPFEGKVPRIHETAFVAPGARIIGDVTIGPEASVWYNCVLRGDIHRIEVGARSNVQDGSVFHVEGPRPDTDGCPTIVGEDCVIGHMAVVHGCTLEDRAFVGMGAVAMDDC